MRWFIERRSKLIPINPMVAKIMITLSATRRTYLFAVTRFCQVSANGTATRAAAATDADNEMMRVTARP